MSQIDLVVAEAAVDHDAEVEQAFATEGRRESKSRNWFFTAFADKDGPFTFPASVKYAAYQKESAPSTGRIHLHFFVVFSTATTFNNAKSIIAGVTGVNPYVAVASKPSNARDYCMKEETRVAGPWEYGTWTRPSPGQRTDLEEVADAMKTWRDEGLPARKILKNVAESHTTANIKFDSGIEKTLQKLMPTPTDDLFVARPWQSKLLDMLKQPADDRTIFWVFDQQGNKGKSRFAKHLLCNYDAMLLSSKVENMSYAYEGQPIVIFDIPRTEAECTNHLFSMAEKLKNGVFFSGKFHCRLKMFDAPHVVFFANFMPEDGVWSSDRMKLIDLNCPDWHAL